MKDETIIKAWRPVSHHDQGHHAILSSQNVRIGQQQ